ncbi:Yip1 family protein [Streptomyces sp. NPDC088725]|uniref:Yip1 family protein n=1 Tax=Streptomyces sp. NPDC088725 TaxID=3365873 RepID=UPI00381CF0AF
MAGFRNGRGRDNRDPQQQPQRQQTQQQPYGRQAPPPAYGGGQQQWPPTGGGQGGGGHGEPEYFGDEFQQPQQHPQQHSQQYPQHPQGAPLGGHQGAPQSGPHGDPFANNPGHTQAFSIDEDAYGEGATYHAGPPAPPAGPRLGWKALLSGTVLRPGATFLQMRDYPVWGTALTVTFIYGLLALFGFDTARDDAINATLSTAVPYVLTTAVAFVIGSLILGVVTHTLARQLGGDGAWQPTVGLAMLIMAITDAPRLIFALFLSGDNSLVQVLGWATWLAAGALFTVMVSKSHDLPWPKALGASAIQLVAILSLIKLGTI